MYSILLNKFMQPHYSYVATIKEATEAALEINQAARQNVLMAFFKLSHNELQFLPYLATKCHTVNSGC